MDKISTNNVFSLGNTSSIGTCSHVSCSSRSCHDKGGQSTPSSPEKSNKAAGDESSLPFSFGRQGFRDGEISSKKPAYSEVLQFGLPRDDGGFGLNTTKSDYSDALKKFKPADSYLSPRHCEGSEVSFNEDELYDIPKD